MSIPPITLGLYTVFRHACADFAGTIAAVKQMGYEGVEMYGEPEQFPAQTVKEVLAAQALPLTGWHVEWRHLQPDTIEDSIRFFHAAGLQNIIIPCLGGKWGVGHTPAQECESRWDAYLARIDAVAARLAREGMRLGYHNHEHEFMIRYGGHTLFDKLYSTMDPAVIMELDTGNAIEGGADPAQICAGTQRTIFLHCKPYSRELGFDVTLGDAADANAWRRIVTAAHGRCAQLVIESESAALDEMENARRCIEGLKAQLAGLTEG
ncbi:MAG: sugar phosphate isomerase/epimerase [Subdoligranulum sp.]|nr:sugar phosphate isomerase/epimerase [Subdoligranulum sp.]